MNEKGTKTIKEKTATIYMDLIFSRNIRKKIARRDFGQRVLKCWLFQHKVYICNDFIKPASGSLQFK